MSGNDMRKLMESLNPVNEEAGCGCGPDCKCGGDCGGNCGDKNCPCECNVNESMYGDTVNKFSHPQELDRFTQAYFEAALWSSSDNADEQGGEQLDKNYSMADIDPETIEKMKADCASFQEKTWDDIDVDVVRAGHDFWLTRNGHGAGFWDGDWPEDVGTRLTELSQKYGEFDLYIGDDGKIYGSPLSESMDENLEENIENDNRLIEYTKIFMDNFDIRGIDNEAYAYKFEDAMFALIQHIDASDKPIGVSTGLVGDPQ